MSSCNCIRPALCFVSLTFLCPLCVLLSEYVKHYALSSLKKVQKIEVFIANCCNFVFDSASIRSKGDDKTNKTSIHK